MLMEHAGSQVYPGDAFLWLTHPFTSDGPPIDGFATGVQSMPSSNDDIDPVRPDWARRAHMNAAIYDAARTASRDTPDAYWAEQTRRLDWMMAPTVIKDVSFNKADFRIRWFADGVLNVAWNCLDRHLTERGDQTAILWEGDEPTQCGGLTYRELHAEVCRMAYNPTN